MRLFMVAIFTCRGPVPSNPSKNCVLRRATGELCIDIAIAIPVAASGLAVWPRLDQKSFSVMAGLYRFAVDSGWADRRA